MKSLFHTDKISKISTGDGSLIQCIICPVPMILGNDASIRQLVHDVTVMSPRNGE